MIISPKIRDRQIKAWTSLIKQAEARGDTNEVSRLKAVLDRINSKHAQLIGCPRK